MLAMQLTSAEQAEVEDAVRRARFFWARERLPRSVMAKKERELRDQLRRSIGARRRSEKHG